MTHNLLIENGQASMFYINEAPWHGLGTKFDKPATAQEAIQAAQLDWPVIKLPLTAGSKRIAEVAVQSLRSTQQRLMQYIDKNTPELLGPRSLGHL